MYILIIVLAGWGAVSMQEFTTQSKCNDAAIIIERAIAPYIKGAVIQCVQK